MRLGKTPSKRLETVSYTHLDVYKRQDVDYVGKQQLKNLLKQFGNGVQLRPTYLVSSGKGVCLLYTSRCV